MDFGPSNIFFGVRIQLFVYLNALRNSGNVTPQGVFYLLMNNKFVKKENGAKRFMFRGYVNSDDVSDLDIGYERGVKFESKVYPIKNEKNGELGSQRGFGHLMSGKGFEDACDYVLKLTEGAAVEIEEGYIAKSPLIFNGDRFTTCDYCNYQDVCARSKTYVRRMDKLDQEEFETIIAKEEK